GWDFANFWNKEYMWSFPSNSASYGSVFGGCKLPGVMLVNGSWPIVNDPYFFNKDTGVSSGYNGWGYMKPTNDIYEEFLKDGKGNARMAYSILGYQDKFQWVGTEMEFYDGMDYQAGYMVYKFQHQYGPADCFSSGIACSNGDNGVVRINFPMMRFAEMLLFRAEANLMKGNAAAATTDLNAIRKRSGLKEIVGNATMQDLYHERRCELAFEYTDHLFDLKRWARSSNSDIKALALAELNADPQICYYPTTYIEDSNGNNVITEYDSKGNAVYLTIPHRNDPDGAYEKRYTQEQGANKVKISDYMSYEDYMNEYCKHEIRGYEAYSGKSKYVDGMMTFPYPSLEIVNANGALKQLPYYE
ncbi:MAG: RagB/SusD family nutrient uptake outer membrane protein, partial [Muribaculaceae bacterium]|nr:RagB/SusD family nutrient uptake outer membrane protein [Muribaculaceae bacterium]